MKSLKHYIVESIKTYKYRIFVAGEIETTKIDLLKFNLQKFNPVKISDPKSTPIQKTLAIFPNLHNERITKIDVEFRYPATEPMVKQLSQLLGIDENNIRMFDTSYADSINNEADGYANEMRESPVLTHEEMGEQPGAKEANKEYGDSYLSSIKKQMEGNKIDIPYEGQKNPNSFDPFKPYLSDDKLGAKSPMSTITRPAKPATGALASK